MDELAAYTAGLAATDGSADTKNSRLRIAQGPAGHDVIRQIAASFGRNVSYSSTNRSLQVDLRCDLSWKFKKPELPAGLDRHYFRGLCDGDGYLTSSQGGPGAVVGFCFNPQREQWLGDLWEEMLAMSGYAFILSRNKPTVHVLLVSNWLHAGELADWLYSDAVISLDEKQALAEQFVLEWKQGIVNGRRSWYLQRDSVRV